MRFPFSKSARIKKKKDFERVFESRRRRKGSLASYYSCPNGLERSRLGLSIGRKYGNAVARNRAKRIIREAFRLQSLTLPKGLDIVVIPYTGTPPLQLGEFEKELVYIFSRQSL